MIQKSHRKNLRQTCFIFYHILIYLRIFLTVNHAGAIEYNQQRRNIGPALYNPLKIRERRPRRHRRRTSNRPVSSRRLFGHSSTLASTSTTVRPESLSMTENESGHSLLGNLNSF